MSRLISCDLHDYFEIACMYHYQLDVECIDGVTLNGMAQNIIQKEKREYLLLMLNDAEILVDLNEIKSIKTMTPNALFNELVISSDN
ncbi:MAG: Rho-binding antiterminator [Cellvibrionaceae bacterium]